MSFAAYKRQFRADQSINPETGRSILVGGAKYNELMKKYGKAQKKKSQKSPTKLRVTRSRSPAKMSMVRSSPARRSPLRQSPARFPAGAAGSRSPMRLAKDPFEVLSDESIMKVLPKLSAENRLLWANASPKVNAIYQRMTL